MCFNRMMNRTGHFWEKRYHSTGFENTDYRRALRNANLITCNSDVTWNGALRCR
jgi:putative transposase